MKTKNRLLLTSAMMLALVAVSGTTATYAWFTSGMTGNVEVHNISAAATGALKVTVTKDSSTKKLTDVSSANGKSFFKLLNAASKSETVGSNDWKGDYIALSGAESTTTAYFYKDIVTYSVDSYTDATTKWDIYIESFVISSTNLSAALRIAVFTGTYGDAGEGATLQGVYNCGTCKGVSAISNGAATLDAPTPFAPGSTDEKKVKLGELNNETLTGNFTLVTWIEGEDASCVSGNAGNTPTITVNVKAVEVAA